MLKTGDSLDDWSDLNLVEGSEDGHAILSDQCGVFYVTDENGKLQYVGDNELSAEMAFFLSQFGLEEVSDS